MTFARTRYLLRAAEASCFLVVAFAALKVFGFRRIGGLLGRPHEVSPPRSSDVEHRRGVEVHHAIRAAARGLPRRPRCLVRSIAAQAMLRRRGVASTLYLGVARGPEARLRAHAWVRVGSFVVVGKRNAGYTVVMSFRAGGGESAARAIAE